MGFKDFIAVIRAPLGADAETFVREVLRLKEHVPLATMTYDDVARAADYVAVVEYAGRSVVWWMDEVGKIVSKEPSVLGDALSSHYPNVEWAALAIYDVSNFYGFALFQGGRRVRCRSGSFDHHDEDGELLAEEAVYFRPTTERGEDGQVLYEKDGETWEHHQIGGAFVSGPLATRLLGGDLHSTDLDDLLEARWSVFGTPAQLEEYRVREAERRQQEIRDLHRDFDMTELAAHYMLPVSKLRKAFAGCLEAHVQRLLGQGFELEAAEVEDGNIQLFSYFKAARLPLSPNSQIPLRLARTLDPTIKAGEEQGLRLGYRLRERSILPSILAELETPNLPSGLATLVRCHEDESLNRAATAALDEALRKLGAQLDPLAKA